MENLWLIKTLCEDTSRSLRLPRLTFSLVKIFEGTHLDTILTVLDPVLHHVSTTSQFITSIYHSMTS